MAEPIRVLHVDDDADFADLAGTFPEEADDRLEVETAAGADEGLDRLGEGAFDCVVSDYDMPGRDGIEFLREVRGEFPDLPFILFTGQGSEEVASDAIAAGVTDYLQKGQGTDQYAVLANRIANDVEHYRSRRALARRNRELRRYERMINSMREAACVYDADGRFEIVNEYLAEWYGTSRAALEGEESSLIPRVRDEHGGDPYRKLLDGDREELRGEIEDEFPGHGHAVLEYRLTPLWVDGAVEGVVGVARDVTERVDRERELHRRGRAMEAAPIGITITGPAEEDCPIVYANARFRELTGYAADELLGRNPRFLQGADTDPEPVAEMRAAIEAEEPATVELRNYRKDGTEFWNRVTIAPVANESGAVRNYVGFQEEVTDRRELEAELRATTERYRALVENFPAGGVFLYDRNLKCVLAGGEGLSDVGLSPDDVEGGRPRDRYPPAIAEEIEAHLERALEGERSEFEQSLDGRQYLIRTLPVRDAEGTVTRAMAVSQEITERKRRERELQRQNERLEEFAGVVSHDLRNPLEVVDGRLELAREEREGDHLERAAEALDRSRALIDDLLALARQGESVSDTEPVTLPSLAEECWERVGGAGAKLRIESELELDADRTRLTQLLENLVRNAVEHGGEDVTVTIGDLEDGFYVADDGPGIPAEERDQVFESGYSTVRDGTGFGLAIVEESAEAHGWEVAVEESDAGGARFVITGVRGEREP